MLIRFGLAAFAATMIGMLPVESAKANPFHPDFCGECTEGVWKIWVEMLGQNTTPSLSHAYKWYDGAASKGFPRGRNPKDLSILVVDRWNDSDGAYGHVGFVYKVRDWGKDWKLLQTYHYNWRPSTRGDCNATYQFYWVAFHEPTKQVWFWHWGNWSRALPTKGFVYRK